MHICKPDPILFTHYFAVVSIPPLVIHARPVGVAESPTIDVIAEAHPIEAAPGGGLWRWRADALEEQHPGNDRSIRFLTPKGTQTPPEGEPLEVVPRRLVIPVIEPLPPVGIDVAVPIGIGRTLNLPHVYQVIIPKKRLVQSGPRIRVIVNIVGVNVARNVDFIEGFPEVIRTVGITRDPDVEVCVGFIVPLLGGNLHEVA